MRKPSSVSTKPLSHQGSTLASLWRPWATVALRLQAKFSSRDLGAGWEPQRSLGDGNSVLIVLKLMGKRFIDPLKE
jgi:hypothetical protein